MIVVLDTNLAGQSVSPEVQSTGRVRGVVLDPHEARIIDATITVEGSRFVRVIKTNELGEYEIEVPSGVYRIRAEIPRYFPFQRAAFRVDGDAVRMINIVPTQRVLSTGLEVTARGSRQDVTTVSPPQNESFSLATRSGPLLEAVIQFQKRGTDGDFIRYSGAMLTYDSLAIYADTIRLNKRTLELKASGKLVVEDGKQRIHGTSVEANLREGTIGITLTF